MTEHTGRRQDNAPLWPKRLREAAARLDAEGKAHMVWISTNLRELAQDIDKIIETDRTASAVKEG